jgi:hypothetical protein
VPESSVGIGPGAPLLQTIPGEGTFMDLLGIWVLV